ncbi:MAG: hypothetical protein WA484_00580 [Solirubrobacteraceae bacterium]
MAAKSDTSNTGAIGTLLAGWQRTGRHATPPRRDDIAIEADVVRALYGDPSHRRRAHNTGGVRIPDTHGHISRASVDSPSSDPPASVV